MQLLILLSAFTVSQALHFPAAVFFQNIESNPLTDDVKVPVQLGVMSRCPDALLCENVFDEVLKSVSDRIELSLVYIAKLDEKDEDWGVKCKHGPEECAGNIQQLCAAKHEPSLWWKFVQCQNYEGRDKVGDPDLALKCARTVGIDWEESEASKCAGLDGSGKGSEGVALLKESLALGEKLGIEKSCTILINSTQVCIHDGSWKNCENGHAPKDFVRQINQAYDELNPA